MQRLLDKVDLQNRQKYNSLPRKLSLPKGLLNKQRSKHYNNIHSNKQKELQGEELQEKKPQV